MKRVAAAIILILATGSLAAPAIAADPSIEVSASPSVATVDLLNGTATVTSVVTDGGSPAPEVGVQVSVTRMHGEGPPAVEEYFCATDEDGRCEVMYSSPVFPGTDQIRACVAGGGACADTTVTWVLPTGFSTGQLSGHGSLLPVGPPGSFDEVKFDLRIGQRSNGKLDERCAVLDPNPWLSELGADVQCVDVTYFEISGTHAFAYGHATVNGVLHLFRLDADDSGRGSEDPDQFAIQTDNGYGQSGSVVKGDLKIDQGD